VEAGHRPASKHPIWVAPVCIADVRGVLTPRHWAAPAAQQHGLGITVGSTNFHRRKAEITGPLSIRRDEVV